MIESEPFPKRNDAKSLPPRAARWRRCSQPRGTQSRAERGACAAAGAAAGGAVRATTVTSVRSLRPFRTNRALRQRIRIVLTRCSAEQLRPTPTRSRDSEYGPPPGYQPIILPGESISKYRAGSAQQPAGCGSVVRESARSGDAPVARGVNNFPEDEPLFAHGPDRAAP